MNNNMKNQEDSFDRVEQRKKSYWPYLFLLAILLFFCVFGITYSIYFDDREDNELNTGKIAFTYSDANGGGNGIYMENAFPTSDVIGKAMVGSRQYFDFFVTASTDNSNLLYQILVNKNEASTLANQNVRIYLTQVMGSYEQETVLCNFSDLAIKKIDEKEYYVLYETVLEKGLKNYMDSYRLRMWIREDAIDYEQKNFSIKIDVIASQVKEK